jgi:hypothetical protein
MFVVPPLGGVFDQRKKRFRISRANQSQKKLAVGLAPREA